MSLKKEILIAIGITFLFLGLVIQPSVAVQTKTEKDIEPKDYLFQTIIDITNNPEVKNLLGQQGNDLFKLDIDRSVYRKLFLRNPIIMFNTLFTKPSMTIEYLNKCYKNGIEITDVLGEDKTLEMIENVEITNSKLFDELNNIITKDKELSDRLEILKKMNEELKPVEPFEYNPVICNFAFILFLIAIIIGVVYYTFSETFQKLIEIIGIPILKLFILPITFVTLIFTYSLYFVSLFLIIIYDCIDFYPYI